MATIVQHLNHSGKYILLGTGFGAFKSTRPSFFGGNLVPHEDEGVIKAVAVCDKDGVIQWFNPEDLRVIEVDGVAVADVLPD